MFRIHKNVMSYSYTLASEVLQDITEVVNHIACEPRVDMN